jgi:hypothetical protein
MSKKLLYWAIAQFMMVVFFAIISDLLSRPGMIYTYLIPTSGAFVTATSAGYLYKSKVENSVGGIIYDTAMKGGL